MRYSSIPKFLVLLVLSGLLLMAASALAYDDVTVTPETLSGEWASVSCEHRPPADQPTYLKRNITFDADGKIAIIFHQFADSFCEQPTFSFYFGGQYEVIGESKVADGAVESIITIDDVRMTPDSEDMAGFFNTAEAGTCGTDEWVVGTEQAVSETGCSVFGLPAGLITTEYELFYIKNDFLFFAARPLDGSFLDGEDKRPGALLVPILRVK